MNAVFAAVLLAVVATCTGTVVTSGLGAQYYYNYPSASAVQYVQPSTYQYKYVQPVVSAASTNYVSQAYPVNYVANSGVVPTASAVYPYAQYGVNYPYTYTYGGYGLLKK